jgi:hypothetical protein
MAPDKPAGKASELVKAALSADPHSLLSLLPSDVLPILSEADLHSAFEAGLENFARRHPDADSSYLSALGASLVSAWYGDPVLLATLSDQFPQSVPLLRARLEAEPDKGGKVQILEAIRKLQPSNLHQMDEYAYLLYETNPTPPLSAAASANNDLPSVLSALSYSLLKISASSPVPWSAMALFILSPLPPCSPLALLPTLDYEENPKIPDQRQ